MLMIDFYSLRCEQYEYFVNLYNEWEHQKNVSLLPNFRYSVALALYYMALHSNDNSVADRSDSLLQEALIMFPAVLMPLLDACSVETDSEVAKCDYFNSNAQLIPQALTQLVALYVGRCHLLWKDKQIMSWLEGNVRQVMQRIKSEDPFVKKCAEM